MKLKTKFSIITSSLITLILAGVTFFLFIAEKRHLETKMYEQLEETLNKLSKICEESILAENDVILINYITTLKKYPGVVYVVFIDRGNKVLMHSDLSQRGQLFKSELSKTTLQYDSLHKISYINQKGKQILELSIPVKISNKKIGAAIIGYNQIILEKSISDTLYETGRRIMTVFVVSLFIGIIAILSMVHMMTKNIRALTRGASMIGHGNFEHRIKITTKDELGELSKDFNVMASKLAELDKMKDDFVDTVSHELRSPLAAIKGYAQSLNRGTYGGVTNEQKEVINIIMFNADRLTDFVNDILDVAKIKSGRLEINKEETDFTLVAIDVLKMLKPLSEEFKLQLEIKVAGDLPKIFVDQEKLKQVITNLVANAMKFTPPRGRVTVTAQDNDENFILAGVRDTGIGIPKDKLSSVFDKFSQVKEAQQASKAIRGTGLGLTISKNIVEMHNGKIWVESEEGRGAIFYFTLPKHEMNQELLQKTQINSSIKK